MLAQRDVDLEVLVIDGRSVDATAQIVSDLAVVYKAEARLRDVLRLDVGIADPNRYGGDVVCRVVRAADDTLVAIAKVNLVFFDYRGAKRPVPAPTQFTRAITGESRSD